ncbi:MAG: hypothetical protein KA444_02170 [Bacteroidia bacterium]|nr:hypothetical protein [Bacteroidia bacterium]
MNQVHVHLLLNHVSILAAFFSLVILTVGLIRSEQVLIRTAMFGFLLSALVSIPVFLTGEAAEEAVENLPGITEATIEEHEEAAAISIWVIEILGAISLIGLFIGNKYQRTITTLLVVVGIVAVVSLSYTGLEGGKIRHSEIEGTTDNAGLVPQQESGDEEEDH